MAIPLLVLTPPNHWSIWNPNYDPSLFPFGSFNIQQLATFSPQLQILTTILGVNQVQGDWLNNNPDFTNQLYDELTSLDAIDEYDIAAALIAIEVNRLGLPDNFTNEALKAILIQNLPPALRIYVDIILPYTILQYNLEVEKDPAMVNKYWGAGRGILYWRATQEITHLGLDFAGMAPVVGEIFDITNGAIYILQGQYFEAGVSLASAVPMIGNIPAAARIITKGKKIIIMIKKANGLWHFPRKSLRNVLGLVTGDGKIAHHLIPLGEEANELVQKAVHWGFDMNSLNNAKALDAAIHTGSHSIYSIKVNQEMNEILNKYPSGISPEVAKAELDGLINRIRAWIGNNSGLNIDNIIL